MTVAALRTAFGIAAEHSTKMILKTGHLGCIKSPKGTEKRKSRRGPLSILRLLSRDYVPPPAAALRAAHGAATRRSAPFWRRCAALCSAFGAAARRLCAAPRHLAVPPAPLRLRRSFAPLRGACTGAARPFYSPYQHRKVADILRISTFWHLKSQKFSGPQGPWGGGGGG